MIAFEDVRGLEAAIEQVSRGEFGTAYEAALAEPDPLRRAQAELYVRHHAGDLAGALASGERGLAATPDDAWLLERCAYIALTLRHAHKALEYARRLDLATARGADADRTRFAAAAQSALVEAQSLASSDAARRNALSRARVWVASALLGSLLLLFAATRR